MLKISKKMKKTDEWVRQQLTRWKKKLLNWTFDFVQVASNIEIYEQHEEGNEEEVETAHSEPEAMLVEIEDESCEPLLSASSTTPVTQIQIPIFKFDFANRDSR